MKERMFSPVANSRLMGRSKLLSLFFLASCLLAVAPFTTNAATDRKNDKASDKTTEATKNPTVVCEVENFGKVNDNYYRGAQPEEGEYLQLATLGVKTVIDLRNDPKGYAKAKAETAGLRYINLPMSDKNYPVQQDVKKFLELANDQNNWPIYVHCAGGRHRTGAMTAVYRMTQENWDIEKAYAEMKDYDFYTRWGHKAMKTFVFDYWKELQARRLSNANGAEPQAVPATTLNK